MKILCKNKYWEIDKDYDIDKILYLLIDRPNTIIVSYKYFIWKNDKGLWHRNYDLPAVIENYGCIKWIIDNKWRKTEKVAIIYSDGSKLYFINGKYIKTEFTT